VRQADRPAPAQEGDLLGQRRVHRQRQAHRDLGVRAHRLEVLAEVGRSRASALVANRVCTTACSSAKSSTIASVASAAAGCRVGGQHGRRRAPSSASAGSTISVVVPER
jgi:hypothetical protein